MNSDFFKFLETYWTDIEEFINAFIELIKVIFAGSEETPEA